MKTQIFALALVMVVALGAIALPAMAATEGSSTGSFTLNNVKPDVTSVVLYELDETTTTTTMTPQTEYAVKIEAGDTNTLDDIRYVTVVIQKQDYSGTDDVSDQATYQYDRDADPKWSIVGPLSTTWSIDEPDSKIPGDLTGMSGTWCVHFVPGKIAREATWDIKVTVKDDANTEDTLSQTGLSMQWRGEISVDDTSFSFGFVDLATAKNPITTPSDAKVDSTLIANGNYKLLSKSGNWVGKTSGETATLDWDGTLGSGHFQLENDGLNTILDDTTNNVQDSYTTITDYTSVTAPTAETGDSKAVYAWVSLAIDGFIPQVYEGDVTVGIVND
jgi:hypothetical protein